MWHSELTGHLKHQHLLFKSQPLFQPGFLLLCLGRPQMMAQVPSTLWDPDGTPKILTLAWTSPNYSGLL